MRSLKGNAILNMINTLTGVLYPVVTFPYAARVLLPEGIGTINFLNSIISYIVLFTSLGIPLYAVREIARCRDNQIERNRTTIEIIALSFVLCIVGYIGVWILGHFVAQIHSQLSLFYVLSLAIVFTALGVQWFYQAIEDFKFITIRSVIVRTLAAICLFVFVKDPGDILIYGIIIVSSTVGNNLINFIHLRHYLKLDFPQWSQLRIKRHIRPSLQIFMLNVIISLYLHLNAVMLGFMVDDVAVGFYTAGNKISHISLAVITSIGVVMVPRTSNLVKNNQWDEFRAVSNKAMQVVFALALPSMVGLIALSVPITYIFCGIDFMPAVPVLRLTAVLVLIVSIANVVSLQILYPQGKEKIILWSAILGASMNLAINFWLIRSYSYVGAAMATILAELSVTLFQIFVGRKWIPIKLDLRRYFPYIIATAGMLMYLLALNAHVADYVLRLISGLLGSIVLYASLLWLLKDPIIRTLIKTRIKL